MAELVKPWNDGGNLTVTYEGNSDGTAVFSSDVYDGIDREQKVTFKSSDNSILIERNVRQEGIRQPIRLSGGGVFRVAGGGRFGVLKVGGVDTSSYLTIVALEDGLTASLSANACEYRIDSGGWYSLSADTKTPPINSGQKLQFRGNLTPIEGVGIGTFSISKKCNLEGNCMSLLFGDNANSNNSLEGYNYAFYKLFFGSNSIVSVSNDFLPATTLEEYCYSTMFRNCKSLTTAPVLPATTLLPHCYYYMFQGCSSLNWIKAMFTTTPITRYTNYWVNGVASTGTFVKNKDATWTNTGNSSVPSNWTIIKE